MQWNVRDDRDRAVLLIDGEPVELKGTGEVLVSGSIRRGTQPALSRLQLRLLPMSEDALPKRFALYQNYPNPFNPSSIIRFDVSKPEHVTLQVFNLLGQQVAVLTDEQKSPGVYKVQFNGAGLSSGVYFHRLTAGEFTQAKKLVLMK